MIDNYAAPNELLANAKNGLYYLVENGSKSIDKTKKMEIQYFDDYQAASNKLTKNITIKAPTTINTKLKAPTNLTVEHASNGNIFVSWRDPSGNAKGFIIYRSSIRLGYVAANQLLDNEDIVGIVSASEFEFIDKSTQEGFNYNYRVASYNEEGISDNASQPAVTINSIIKPPTDLSYSLIAYNTIQLNWEDNSAIEEGFILETRDDTTTAFRELLKINKDLTWYIFKPS